MSVYSFPLHLYLYSTCKRSLEPDNVFTHVNVCADCNKAKQEKKKTRQDSRSDVTNSLKLK